MVKVPPGQRPSSAPAPPQGAPGGSGQLGTPRKRPALWAPSHCLECSSQPPPKLPIPPPLTVQVLPKGGACARALDLGAGAGVSTQLLWLNGFRSIEAVDPSRVAWDENVEKDGAVRLPLTLIPSLLTLTPTLTLTLTPTRTR